MEFTFYGHACFKIDTGKESLLFDPFLSGNSQAAVSADKVECDYILLFSCSRRSFRRLQIRLPAARRMRHSDS